jgi:hypothetical protein
MHFVCADDMTCINIKWYPVSKMPRSICDISHSTTQHFGIKAYQNLKQNSSFHEKLELMFCGTAR